MHKKTSNKWQLAFCPWLEFKCAPFDICGVSVTGFQELSPSLKRVKRAALLRAKQPYYEHFLRHGRRLYNGNPNPLIYIIESSDPLKELTVDEVKKIHVVNTFLYLCAFTVNKMRPYQATYTSWADWSLYIHNIRNPKWFSIQSRRLGGSVLSGGHRWDNSAFTRPIESNRYKLEKLRPDLIKAISDLQVSGRSEKYFHSLRTFCEGTTDRESWLREDDIPFIWDAIELLQNVAKANSNYLKKLQVSSSTTGLQSGALTNFFRTVIDIPPSGNMICPLPFNPIRERNGNFRDHPVTKQQGNGFHFSWLERLLDDLREARNYVVHEGFIPNNTLLWPDISLAYVGARFFAVAFKRVLEWETGMQLTDEDECDIYALIELARGSRKDFMKGLDKYQETYSRRLDKKRRDEILAQLKAFTSDS